MLTSLTNDERVNAHHCIHLCKYVEWMKKEKLRLPYLFLERAWSGLQSLVVTLQTFDKPPKREHSLLKLGVAARLCCVLLPGRHRPNPRPRLVTITTHHVLLLLTQLFLFLQHLYIPKYILDTYIIGPGIQKWNKKRIIYLFKS